MQKIALEFIMAGATMVAVGTANFNNPVATEEIIEGIAGFMEKNGVKIKNVEEISNTDVNKHTALLKDGYVGIGCTDTDILFMKKELNYEQKSTYLRYRVKGRLLQ